MIFSSRTIDRPSRLITAALAVAVVAAAMGAVPFAEARGWPAPRRHLSDFAGIIEPAFVDSIEALAVEVEEKTGAEIAVVTLNDLAGETIDPIAVDLFHEWGIGGKGNDDGVLLLLARDERKVRIEVGYGLEGILPDGKCGAIIRGVMAPDLRADRFGAGLLRGTEAISGVIADDRGVILARRGRGVAPQTESGGSSRSRGSFGALLFVAIVFILMSAMFARQRATWGGSRTRRRGWYDPWGGFGGGLGGLGGFGGGGGGGGGGGFGGFGGGKSGGGGASGGF